MNQQEIARIGAEANSEETQAQQQEQAQQHQAAAGVVVYQEPGLAEEFAAVLDMVAKVAEAGTGLPVTQRFSPGANIEIAKAAIKLCATYGYDARALLIGENSKLGVWVGLGFAIGLPGYMTYQDWKVMKAKEVKDTGAAND
jgi:hypothetical protein